MDGFAVAVKIAREAAREFEEMVNMPQVIIRRPSDGREYEISTADFRRGKHFQELGREPQTFEDAGFRIVSLADGQPYEQPAPRAQAEHAP